MQSNHLRYHCPDLLHQYGLGMLEVAFWRFMGKDYTIYYIYFELNGDPCNTIGPHWCDTFTNRTIFLL